jgi:hypothetical protein
VEQAYLARWCAGLEYFERLDTADRRCSPRSPAYAGSRPNFHLHYLGQAFVELQTRFARVVEPSRTRNWRRRRDPRPRPATAAFVVVVVSVLSRASSASTA